MKLLVVLSVIALGYADKLDRTYLPPRNAATAGGSPGALTAPEIQSGPSFGQGLPSGSGSQSQAAGFNQPGQFDFGQGPSGSAQQSNGFSSSNNGVSSVNGFSSPNAGAPVPGSSYDSAFQSRIPSASGFGLSQFGTNQAGIDQSSKGSFDQDFGQGVSRPNVPQTYTPERAQASADRSAEILKYINENNGESYRYSYETSNGIAVEEAGEATNGVRAQGGYSYTSDDGAAYSVTYTADENGYQPQGEHIPTPHPIPEEILKSIEENARAAAAGTQEGAYRPEEYESEAPQQQFNTGSFQPQGQDAGSSQGFQSTQGQAFDRSQSSQFSGNQDKFVQTSPSAVSGQYDEEKQGSIGQFNGKASTVLGQTSQNQYDGKASAALGQTSQGQFNGKPSAGLGQISQSQGQGANGYNYNQPKNGFESSRLNGQGPSSQYRPQVNVQEPGSFSVGLGSAGSGPHNQGVSAPSANGRVSASSSGTLQNQYRAGNGVASSQGQQSSQGYKYGPGSKSFEPAGPSGQGNQYQPNANQNSFDKNIVSKGNQNAGFSVGQNQHGSKQFTSPNAGSGQANSFGDNRKPQSSSSYGRDSQQNRKQPSLGFNAGSNEGVSQFGSGKQAFGFGNAATPGLGPQQNGNQPAFGTNFGSNQGASQFGSNNQFFGSGASSAGTRDSQPIQAPYQYSRPGQSFNPQPLRPGFNGSQGSNGVGQGSQRGSEQFGGPRQPPSFSPEEGYKY